MDQWVRLLREERRGCTMTPDERRIRELERHLRRVEEEKEILKKLPLS